MSSHYSSVARVDQLPSDLPLTSISWHNIQVFSKEKKHLSDIFQSDVRPKPPKEILKGVSGRVSAGQFVAILGSSGSGKTTLLNALTANNLSKFTVKGVIKVNGQVTDAKTVTSLSAYVQQFDIFLPILTVRENLTFQCLLKMGPNLSKHEIESRVQELMDEFNLLKCADVRIGNNLKSKGISGGEAKRLAFASELITNPSILFCDEPTSGLDSFMAENVVNNLKRLSSEGRTVICTIHQPSSQVFALFEQLLLIAEGRVAFMGAIDEAMNFFGSLDLKCPDNYNPADFYISQLSIRQGQESVCREKLDMICSSYAQSSHHQDMVRLSCLDLKTSDKKLKIDNKFIYKASLRHQFSALIWRSFLTTIREPLICRIRIIHSLAVALLLGTVFWKQDIDQRGLFNINALLFLLIMNMCLQTCFAVFDTFCAEVPLFLREHRNGMYRVDIYFLCKTLADIPIFTLVSFIFVTVLYFMVGLNPQFSSYLIALTVVILITHCAVSYGYLISCLSSSSMMAMSLGPPLLMPLILFSGFLLNNQTIPSFLTWCKYISWFYFAYESVLINQWRDIDNITCPQLSFNSTQPLGNCLMSGQDVIDLYDFDRNHLLRNIMALLATIVIIRVMAFLVLFGRSRSR